MAIVDLDAIDYGPEVGFPERNVTSRQPLSHHATEFRDLFAWVFDQGSVYPLGALERGTGRLSIDLERLDPFFKEIVNLSEAVLNHFVEPAEPLISLFRAGTKTWDTLIRSGGTRSAPRRD